MGCFTLASVGERKGRGGVVVSMRGAGVRVGEIGIGSYSYGYGSTEGQIWTQLCSLFSTT